MANINKPAQVNNIWSVTGTKTDPGAAKSNTGWVVELPQYQTANYIEWKQDTYIAHSNQHGIAVWDAVTEYQGGQSYTKGANGLIYKALITNTNLDPTNALNSNAWTQAFEVYGSVAIVQNALTLHLANYATLSGITNAAAARTNLSVYSKAEGDARYAAVLGDATKNFAVAPATQPFHAVRLGQVSGLLTQATEATAGIAALATNADAAAGTDDTKIMTPLKTRTVYLHKAGNLAGLANVTTARANLGLGTAAVMARSAFMEPYKNLTDLTDPATARSALGLTSTATRTEDYFVRTGLNLGDIPNKASARANLGIGTAATYAIENFLQPGYSLSDVASVPAARANLGLGIVATFQPSQVLQPGYNLGDLSNVQAARNNLGLGSAATRNVVGINGDLDFSSTVTGPQNWYRLPNGMIHQFGNATISKNSRVGWTIPMNVGSIQITIAGAGGNPSNLWNRTVGIDSIDTAGFNATAVYGTTIATISIFWHATGWL